MIFAVGRQFITPKSRTTHRLVRKSMIKKANPTKHSVPEKRRDHMFEDLA